MSPQTFAQPLRLLVIDDDAVDRQSVRRHLRAAGVEATVDERTDARELVALMTADAYDCLILDYHLPGETAVDVIARLAAAGIRTPVLCITGQDEEVGAATVAAGASDFLAKVDLSPSRLARRLRYVLRLGRAEAQSRAARAELEGQRRLLDAVVAQLPTGVVMVDRELTGVLVANARAEQVVGPGASELFAAEPGPIATLARRALADALASGAANTVEQTVSHDGRELRIGATPVITDRAVAAMLVIDDVTAEVAARRVAEQSAKAREELLAIVSHDLRGPLSAIGIALDGLRDPELDAAARERYVAAVQRSVARAERLIRDLLLAQQLEVGKVRIEPRALAVRSLLEQVARDHELMASTEGVKLVIEIGAETERVWADRDRIGQAFANLFDNAFRHARGTPTIELGARRDDDGAVHLSVRDHGPGVAAEALPHVFDRYWQGRTRRGGAGLGLAIVRGIARAHGGDATVANHPDGGAQFTIVLPPPPAA